MSSPKNQNQNALTHGLTSNTLLHPNELATYNAVTARWTNELAPCCEAERTLIHNAAIASVRIERCQQAEAAAATLAQHRALLKLQSKRRHAVRKLAQSLQSSPAATHKALKSTPEGCDWLIARYQELDAQLAHGLPLEAALADRLFHLAGLLSITPGPGATPEVLALWWLYAAQFSSEPPRDIRAFFIRQAESAGLPIPARLPDPADARSQLRQHIAHQIESIEQARQTALENDSELRLLEESAAVATAQVPTDPSSLLRHRYEISADRVYRQSIALLLRIRQDRRRADAEAHRASGSKTRFSSAPAFPAPNEHPAPTPSPDPNSENHRDLRQESPVDSAPSPERTRSDSAAPSLPNLTPTPLQTPISPILGATSAPTTP